MVHLLINQLFGPLWVVYILLFRPPEGDPLINFNQVGYQRVPEGGSLFGPLWVVHSLLFRPPEGDPPINCNQVGYQRVPEGGWSTLGHPQFAVWTTRGRDQFFLEHFWASLTITVSISEEICWDFEGYFSVFPHFLRDPFKILANPHKRFKSLLGSLMIFRPFEALRDPSHITFGPNQDFWKGFLRDFPPSRMDIEGFCFRTTRTSLLPLGLSVPIVD